jgi:hypothetical protein
MSDSDDQIGDDPEMDEFVKDYQRHRDDIHELIMDYMDEEDLDPPYLAQVLIDLMIRMRMSSYGFGVENPSVGGLKLDLDRLQAELADFLREAKKGAAMFIEGVKQARAEVDAEDEAEEDEGEDEADK